MFEKSPIFVVLKNKKVQRLQMDASISEVRIFFTELLDQYQAYHKQPFSISYHNKDDELSYVDGFIIDPFIEKAIKDPTSIDPFKTIKEQFEQIVYLFVGEILNNQVVAVFQKFKKPKVLQRGLNIFTSADTLQASTEPFFAIEPRLDCIFQENRLFFNNIYYARMIFDMRNVFIEATDSDLITFIQQDMFIYQNEQTILTIADQNVRRTITAIKGSGMLEKYSARRIKQIADEIHVPLQTQKVNGKEKIVLPDSKKDLWNLLKILEETVFLGVLSDQWLETNSKKQFVP
jgi:hypothetical protein